MNEILAYFAAIVFRSPERLWVIVPIAILFFALFLVKYPAARAALKKPWIREHLEGARIPSKKAYIVSCVALILGSALLAGVWAEPERKIRKDEPVYGKVRIAFLFDSSRSMFYGEDVAPTRIAAAKKTVAEFVEKLREDAELKGRYELALIPFAGSAIHSYSSFTTSNEEFLWFLENINESTLSYQGTSFLAALQAYKILLEKNPTPQETANLAILISDGGKEEGVLSDRNLLDGILKTLVPRPVLYTVGIGSKERDGRTKPVRLIVRDADGVFIDYLRKDTKDKNSPILTSELDESMLKFLATPTPGDTALWKKNYHFFTDKEEILALFKDFVIRYRVQVGTTDTYQYEPVLALFLLPAFLIFYFFFGFGGWIWHGIVRFFSFFSKHLR